MILEMFSLSDRVAIVTAAGRGIGAAVAKAFAEAGADVVIGARTESQLEEVAADLNEAAYRAGKAETERLRCLIARLFSNRIGEAFAGNVVSVKPFGLVVQLAGLGVTGTVMGDSLPDGPYHVDAATQSLVGKKRRYVIGEPIEVQISATDERLGRLELEPTRPRE